MCLVGCVINDRDSMTENEQYEAPKNHEEWSGEQEQVIAPIMPIKNEVDARPFLPEYMLKEAIDGVYSQSIADYKTPDMSQEKLVGGIIPHHNLAYPLIGDFYREMAKMHKMDPFDVIVIISPNHYSIGTRFQVSDEDYYTYGGVVRTDHYVVQGLLNDPLIHKADKEVIANEHGQLVHMPYIKAFLPDIPVVSIMMGETRDNRGIDAVVTPIKNTLEDKHVLYIASIDFSHYLTLEEANRKDEKTEAIIREQEIDPMAGLSNDYIDSPSSYVLFLTLLKAQYEDHLSLDIANHTNAAVIANNPQMDETTSYFQVFYSINK